MILNITFSSSLNSSYSNWVDVLVLNNLLRYHGKVSQGSLFYSKKIFFGSFLLNEDTCTHNSKSKELAFS